MMRRLVVGLFGVAAAFAMSPARAAAQGQAEQTASPASMVGSFESSCMSCHDNTNPDNRAPSREVMRQMAPERVLAAVTTGPMATYAERMSDPQKRALAELVTGRPLGDGSVVHRTAAAMSNQCGSPLSLDNSFTGPSWNGWSACTGRTRPKARCEQS